MRALTRARRCGLAVLASLAASCGGEPVPAPPSTRVAMVVDTIHGVPVPDH